MNRYSLIARYKDNGRKVIIPLPTYTLDQEGNLIYDKINRVQTKTLSHIDSLTQKYNNEKHLIEELNNGKYIDSKNVDMYISYKVNNEERYVEILYKDDSPFYTLTDNFSSYSSKVNIEKPEFKKMINVWFSWFSKEDFRNFLIRNEGLNNHFKDNLINCYKIGVNVNKQYYFNRIISEFESYKNLRDLYELFKEYNDENYKMEVEEKRAIRKSQTDSLDYYALEINEKRVEETDVEGGNNKNSDVVLNLESITPLDTDTAWKEYYDLDDVDNMNEEEQESLGLNPEEHNIYKAKKLK